MTVVLALALPTASAEETAAPVESASATASAPEQPTTLQATTTDEATTDEATVEPSSTDEATVEPSTTDEATVEPSSTDEATVEASTTDKATVGAKPTAEAATTVPPTLTKGAAKTVAVAPMVVGVPDGGTTPYVYWDVRDTAGNLVSGATFTFEYRSGTGQNAGWKTGTNASGITDCNGTCPTAVGGNSLERDTDGGEWLLEHRGTDRADATQLSSTSNYRVSQFTAPAGYQWVVSGTNTQTIGSTNSNSATWNNAGGTGTHNFGTFYVRSTSLAKQPACTAGFVYGISETGQIREVAPNGTVTDLGSSASGVSSFNGIGIGAGGSPVFAYERTSSNQIVTIWRYDTTLGTWSSTGVQIDSTSGSRTVGFVAGGVNLQTGQYFFGGFSSDGKLFRIWEYPTAISPHYMYRGAVDTSVGAGGSNNGDLAFDAAGNLFIVRGSGSITTVFSVTAADLAAAAGGTIPASGSTSVTTMGSVNGVAFDSSGKAFLGSSTELRAYDMPTWSNSTSVVGSGLNSTDLATCSSPPTITIEKFIQGGRVNTTDQFALTLTQGTQTIGTATTTGTAIGLQGQRIGPLPTVRNVALTFTESASGMQDLDNYASSYRCLVDGVQTVQGNGISGTITIPANGQSVNCRFFNSPLVATVKIHKDVTDVLGLNPTARQGWTVGATTAATIGTATPSPTATTQATDASGNALWSVKFDAYTSRATVTVSEAQQTGYAFQSGQCVVTHLDGITATTPLPSEAGKALTGIQPGDTVECGYVNKPKPGSVTWNKVDNSTPPVLLGGSEWTITGANVPANTVVVDCTASPCAAGLYKDQDPVAGQFKLEGLAWGTYTATETKVPAGYEGAAAFTFTVDATNAGTTIIKGNQINTPVVSSVTWSKVDDSTPAVLLGGSEWTITGPGFPTPGTVIVDCVAVGCTGLDKDPVAGQFKLDGLAFGDYTVVESKVPEGHEGAGQFSFTINSSNAGTTIIQGPKVNKRKLGAVTWSKVDDSTPPVLLGGSEWTITGPGYPTPGTVIVDCVAATCTGLDKDPAVGQFKLESLAWGDYTVVESKVPAGHEGAGQFGFTINSSNAGTTIIQGPKVNKRKLGAVTWSKVDDSTPAVLLGGSEWTITGPGFPTPGTVIVDCVAATCTGLDKDPAVGQFRLEGLAWGDYTVVESKVPAGFEGAGQFSFTINSLNAGTTIIQGPKVNTRKLGTVTWTKVDAADKQTMLAGSEWMLTGDNVPANTIVVDCTAAQCAGGQYKDQDPAPGKFKLTGLPWGSYSLKETKAPPGYIVDPTEHPFTVGFNNVNAEIVVGAFPNQLVTPPTLPLTGGLSRDLYTFAGLAVIGVALVGYRLRRRTHNVTVR